MSGNKDRPIYGDCGCLLESVDEVCAECNDCKFCCECTKHEIWECSDCGNDNYLRLEYGSRVVYVNFDANGRGYTDETNWDYVEADGWKCSDCGNPASEEALCEIQRYYR